MEMFRKYQQLFEFGYYWNLKFYFINNIEEEGKTRCLITSLMAQ